MASKTEGSSVVLISSRPCLPVLVVFARDMFSPLVPHDLYARGWNIRGVGWKFPISRSGTGRSMLESISQDRLYNILNSQLFQIGVGLNGTPP